MGEQLALLGGPKAIQHAQEMSDASAWPRFDAEERAAVLAAMEAKDVYAENQAFERDFAAYTGARFALAHNNGTSALHAAYFAVGVQPGDEVLAPAYTWHLQVNQILALHAIPVFCDVDPYTGCIDPSDAEKKISPRTRAIAVLHPFGAVAPMDEILAVARAHGLAMVEDCSHAHGATYRGRKVGTLGDVGCYSLQASKLMTAVEGGVLITNSEECYARACLLGHYERLPGLQQDAYSKYHQPNKEQAPACFGFKYRMHPFAAALARAQLKHLDAWQAVRRQNMGYLTRRLAEVGEGILVPPPETPGAERTWLNYICLYHAQADGVPRERFIEALQAEGLPATGGRTGYLPVYWNPLYQERRMWAEGCPFDAPYVSRRVVYQRGMCPVAESYWRRTVGLPVLHRPVSQQLLDEMVEAVAKVVRQIGSLRS
ncbi:MAG: DegT/DnrJ/EryC1/StrS family aminotransferase [Armatimonadota bacterium]|nr:DegT/DnrJ/EryC1/StrS family aminotransferase [Armatimonadota bacterium]